MRVMISTIPHHQQRYPTVGDWLVEHNQLRHIRVSEMGNEDYHFLVAMHELIEAYLCKKRGITQQMVDEFDKAFEIARSNGDDSEPGDHPVAPYRREHRFAENIERQIAHELGVDWQEYDRTVGEL